MIKENQFNILKEFMKAYFHVDWGLDDENYESVWKSYFEDTNKESEHVLPLYKETKEVLKYSPKEIRDFLCDECDFCLSTEHEAHDWIKSFNQYISQKIKKM